MSPFAIRTGLAFAIAIITSLSILPAGDAPSVKLVSHNVAIKTGLERFKAELAAEPEPFDLTYVPRSISEIQAITAIHPAAIFAHHSMHKKAASTNALFADLRREFCVSKGSGPGIEAIESLIVCGTAEIRSDKASNAEKPFTAMIGGRSFVIRTTKPYDWATAVKRWFPCVAASHREVGYLTTPMSGIPFMQMMIEKMPANEKQEFLNSPQAFFMPDNRTLVIENEIRIRELIDRLQSGQRELTPPPGWEKVNRGVLAIAINNHKKLLTQFFATNLPGPFLPKNENTLFVKSSNLTLGIEVGTISRFNLIVVCPDQFAAKVVQRDGKCALGWLADCFAPDSEKPTKPLEEGLSKLMDALLLDGQFKPTPLGFEYTGEVRENLLPWLASVLE